MKRGGKASTSVVEGTQLVSIGAALFAVAWFVPVFRGQDLIGAMQGWPSGLGGASANAATASLDAPEWLPGWGACHYAWQILIDATASGNDTWKQRLAGSSCLTNLVMLAALVMAIARRRQLLAGLVVLGCVLVNASWIYLVDRNPFEIYRVGYFLWLGSFALVGVGLLLRSGRT